MKGCNICVHSKINISGEEIKIYCNEYDAWPVIPLYNFKMLNDLDCEFYKKSYYSIIQQLTEIISYNKKEIVHLKNKNENIFNFLNELLYVEQLK